MYPSGRSFELETDHKPLERIYSHTSKPCVQVERWVLQLKGYNFKGVYQLGKTIITGALSHLNSMKQLDRGEEYDFTRAVVESCMPVALSPKEIEEAYGDEELCEIWELDSVQFLHIHTSKTDYAPMGSFCFVL